MLKTCFESPIRVGLTFDRRLLVRSKPRVWIGVVGMRIFSASAREVSTPNVPRSVLRRFFGGESGPGGVPMTRRSSDAKIDAFASRSSLTLDAKKTYLVGGRWAVSGG